MRLLCLLTCLADELLHYEKSISCSFGKILSTFGEKVHFLVICQPPKGALAEYCAHPDFVHSYKNLKILEVSYRSVSRARNEGIEYGIKNNFTHIFFHDVSIELSKSACEHFVEAERLLDSVFSVQPVFCAAVLDSAAVITPKSNQASPLRNSFVWSYLFPLSLLKHDRFDPRFGPGDGTLYKSGEDLLFLYEVLIREGRSTVHSARSGIFHPPRDENYTKHLIYAKGQGHSLRLIVSRYGRIGDYIYTALFFGNAVLRVLFFRNNSLEILKQRIIGFTTKP